MGGGPTGQWPIGPNGRGRWIGRGAPGRPPAETEAVRLRRQWRGHGEWPEQQKPETETSEMAAAVVPAAAAGGGDGGAETVAAAGMGKGSCDRRQRALPWACEGGERARGAAVGGGGGRSKQQHQCR